MMNNVLTTKHSIAKNARRRHQKRKQEMQIPSYNMKGFDNFELKKDAPPVKATWK